MTEFTGKVLNGYKELIRIIKDTKNADKTAYMLVYYAEQTIDHIERQEARIAELEQERRWIHQDNTMIVKKDGDSWCFVLPDFVNLQESEAQFFNSDYSSVIDRIYNLLQPLPQPPKEGE